MFAVGKNVKDIKVGDRVYPYPLLVTGDKRRAGTIGGFSEYIYCPHPIWEESIYHIDESISDKVAVLTEPFTVGCRAAKRGLPEKLRYCFLAMARKAYAIAMTFLLLIIKGMLVLKISRSAG